MCLPTFPPGSSGQGTGDGKKAWPDGAEEWVRFGAKDIRLAQLPNTAALVVEVAKPAGKKFDCA